MILYTRALCTSHVGQLPHGDWDPQCTYEPAGSEPITTGNISKCASFWRTCVKRKWVMGRIDNGYDLVWETTPPVAREIPNSKLTLEYHEFVTSVISEMVEAGAASAFPTCVIPTIVSPLGVVPKPHSNKSRLVVNMIYVNKHRTKRVFKLEGLSDIADMAKKGNFHCPMTSLLGTIMWHYTESHHVSLDLSGRVFTIPI